MIRLEDVVKTHHRGRTDVPALRGVSCEIADGTFTFIVGPSGSGKSSLLYLIGALDEPTAGRIYVRDRLISGLSARERDEYRRTEVGFIFQSFNLLANLDAVGNVLVPFLPTGVTPQLRSRAVALLEQVGLGARLDHRPSELSGGEQQRVAIARALLKQPTLVLADEPTGELDTTNGAEVLRYLRNLCQERGTTVVIVTHDQSYLSTGDHVVRLRDGVVVRQEKVAAGLDRDV